MKQRSMQAPPPLTFGLFVRLTALFVVLSAVSGADLVFRGLRRRPGLEQTPVWSVPGGVAQRGPAAIRRYGCGSCHVIPGVRSAEGRAGPSLQGFGSRMYIAGRLSNTPPNLVAWIREPARIDPETAMPDLDVSESDALDIAAFLYANRR